MKTKYIIALLVVGMSIMVTSANPQILTYYSGHWFNDRMEEVNSAIIIDYREISQNPWTIEVISPQLQYQNERTYNNGETISIQKGNDTITVIADVTTTLTVTP